MGQARLINNEWKMPASSYLSRLLGDHKVLILSQHRLRICRASSREGVIDHVNIAVVAIVCPGALRLPVNLHIVIKGEVYGVHAGSGRGRQQATCHLTCSTALLMMARHR